MHLQVDAIETASHYQLHVALPGIPKGLSQIQRHGILKISDICDCV